MSRLLLAVAVVAAVAGLRSFIMARARGGPGTEPQQFTYGPTYTSTY
jgi:hypothetical protein